MFNQSTSGKLYVTRGGQKACYLRHANRHTLYVDGLGIGEYEGDGTYYSPYGLDLSDLDILSEYYPPKSER